jgi:hypothetical protein
MAVPLDHSRRRLSGRPVPVHDPVAVIAANNGNSGVFLSRGGALVTGVGTHRAQLNWIGRDGVARPISGEVRDFREPRLSPDGRRIAVLVSDGARSDIWIHDLATGTLSRLTTAETVTSVQWTGDGSRVVYSAAGRDSRVAVWRQSVDAASAPEALVSLPGLSPVADISPDGRWLLLQSLIENWEVLKVSLDSAPAIRPFVATEASELTPRFSPDGRWAVVTSDESGTSEAYIRSFPEPTVKSQISAGGAFGPVWSADGTRLYYVSGTAIMEARLALDQVVRVVSRDTAFAPVPNAATIFGQANFAVSRDGGRIVIPVAQSAAYRLVVVPNWLTEFRERLAASRK